MNNLHKKPNDQKLYLPSFEPKESDLELTAKDRSVDRLVRLTLDNVSDEAKAVLDFSNMVSEEEKWEEAKAIKHEFIVIEETIAKVLKNKLITNRDQKPDPEATKLLIENLLNYINILEVELNSKEAVNALGREVIYLLNAMIDTLKKEIEKLIKVAETDPDNIFKAVDQFSKFKNDYFDKLYSGFVTEDTSSAPVQIQIFDNFTKALWIPPHPMADIVSLYDDFKSLKPGDDYARIMKDRFKKFLEPKRKELEEQIEKEKERALKLKKDFESKVNPKFQELLRRYADYWISMTPERLYEYIIKRRAVENFAEGRVSLDQMEALYKVWFEMATQRPTSEDEIPKGEKEAPPYEDYKITE